jgi:hypothetical protein
MKLLAVLMLTVVAAMSGCTQTGELPENGNQTDNGSLSTEIVIENKTSPISALPTSPAEGWFCGSFKINASVVGDDFSQAMDAARLAGFSFFGLLINHSNPDVFHHLGSCEKASQEGFLCIPTQVVGDCEGQFVAIGVNEMIEADSLQGMLDQVHDLGGVSYITHPMQHRPCLEWRRWDLSGWDGLAVVSPMTQSASDDEEAIRQWHAFLDRGRRVHAFGETDTKPYLNEYGLANILDSSYQCLNIPGNLTAESVTQALMQGRFYATNGPILDFTVDGHGIGDSFNVSYGHEVNVSLSISSLLPFNRVKIIRNGVVIQEVGKDLNRFYASLNSTIAGETWFTVEVWGPDHTGEYHDFVHAFSNPVWVNVGTHS